MAYSRTGDVRKLLGDPDEQDLATDTIQFHQRRADSYINGRLGHLYTIPFNPVPDQVRTWSENLTAYEILFSPGFRLRNPVDTAMVNERYQVTVADIKDCARRKFRLDGTAPHDPTHSTTEQFHTTFGLDRPENWGLDPDQENQISSTRKQGGGIP